MWKNKTMRSWFTALQINFFTGHLVLQPFTSIIFMLYLFENYTCKDTGAGRPIGDISLL